jgi:hypothetical protein
MTGLKTKDMKINIDKIIGFIIGFGIGIVLISWILNN